MIRRYKKLFLAFVALLSVFLLASCSQKQSSSKNAAKTETAKVETIDGEWELVDTLDALTESIGAYTLHGIHFAHLLESVKDFKMDMKIENNTATIKYDYNIDNFIKAFYTVTTDARGKTEEEFKKIMYDSHEGFAGDFKKYKVSMNKDTGVFSYEATGSIDQGAKTMTFDEGLSVANSFFFSFGENRVSPNTYHYKLKDDMLYVTIDGKAKKNNLPVHYELHFKRKGSTTQKDPVPIEGKWQAIDFRPALERSLAFKDFDNDDSAIKLIYPEAWKDLKPTLNITDTSVEFDYTVSLADGFGRFYDYLKQKDASKVTQTKDEYIKNQFIKVYLLHFKTSTSFKLLKLYFSNVIIIVKNRFVNILLNIFAFCSYFIHIIMILFAYCFLTSTYFHRTHFNNNQFFTINVFLACQAFKVLFWLNYLF